MSHEYTFSECADAFIRGSILIFMIRLIETKNTVETLRTKKDYHFSTSLHFADLSQQKETIAMELYYIQLRVIK